MITYTLPRRIRYVPASALFTATFNTTTPGAYDFNNSSAIFIEKLTANTLYMIDSFSVAGNVASEDYLSSLSTTPLFYLQKTIDNENIFDGPIQIQNFFGDKQIVHFFKTGQNNCGIKATIDGILNQIPAFVGLPTITLSVDLSLHAIDDSDFEKNYKKEA